MSTFDSVLYEAVKCYDPRLTLKDKQREVLMHIFNGSDCISVLPTGYGKSVIFQLIPLMMTIKARNVNGSESSPMMALVVSPINAIMEDQLQSLVTKGIKSCLLNMEGTHAKFYLLNHEGELSDNVQAIEQLQLQDFSLMYAHPETLISNSKIRKMLSTKLYQRHICCTVVDEVHMISEWGDEFRPSFRKLGELTALFPDIPHLALTATATPEGINKLCKVLQFRDVKKIVANPDRPNIYYEIRSRLPNLRKFDKYDDLIEPLCCKLKELRSGFPVTIVYMDSLESLGYCYQYLESSLQSEAYEPVEDPIPENRIFAMFHKDYTNKMKLHLIQDLRKLNPKTRLVLATVALGMGLNAPSVDRVIHFRPPTTMEKYMQESGRAGRAGQPAQAILYFNNNDIASNRPGLTEEMKMFCQSESCLRYALLQYLQAKSRYINNVSTFVRESCLIRT